MISSGTTALLLAAAHMVGDFVAQTNWMAANKFVKYETRYFSTMGEPGQPELVAVNFWFSAWVRAVHVTVYTAGFAPILLLTDLNQWLLFLAMLWITHFITDCRRWASGEKWEPKPILVDQSIHLATIAVLAALFGL